MKGSACVFFAATLLLVGGAPARAQVQPSRWSSVKSFRFGSVDRATLANRLEIPIYSRAGVGHAQLQVALAYNSNFWSASGPGSFGWSLAKPFGALTASEEVDGEYCGWWNDSMGQYDGWDDLVTDTYTFTEPDGSTPAANYATSEYLTYGGGSEGRGDYWDCPSSVSGTGTVLIPDGKG